MTSLRAVRRTYRNPVHDGYFADPFALRVGDSYVAYGTGASVDGRVFEVLGSPDLASWTSLGGALEPVDPALGADYWAPEVAQADGRFWMYYSVGHGDAGHHLRVAVADAAAGPFVDLGVNLTPDERFAIDPHPFRDVDGTWYLFFARDVLDTPRVGTQLAVAVLTSMTTTGPTTTVLQPSADWQLYARDRPMYGARHDWHTLEGPTVREHGGTYHCFYSGGSWQGEGYAVSWATAPHPLGPWSDPVDGGRLLQTVPGHVRGPGHNSVVTTPGGTDVLVYHAWDATGSARQLCIDPLVWTADGPTTSGPSWQERPLPA